MNDLDLFLKDLSDVELAKFIAYRLNDFLGTSKEKIIAEAKLRNLNHEDLKRLFNEYIQPQEKAKNKCLQCGSTRLFVETDYDIRQRKYSSYEVAIESNRCRICGYNPEKNSKGFLNCIKRKLGLFHKTRLKTPEIDGNMFT